MKEGHHFDQSLGGVAGFFENMRSNTQALINTNVETEKSIKGSVLPILERLHKEIKAKAKELASGAGKQAKEIEKLRNTTQKHIELLGQHTASYGSAGGRLAGHEDPYVLRRGVEHRLNNQVIAENNHHNDLVSVQGNFRAFEAHVVEVFQQGIEAFTQLAGGQAVKTRALYDDMLGSVQRIPGDFEWGLFNMRCADRLVSAGDAPRSVDAITFPNMDHDSTKSLIEGSLERKSRNKLSFGGYQAGYYVVTPSKYLHEFKDSDNTRHDPKPELSIFLPDATIGSPNGEKFNVKGKDTSKTIGSRLTGSSELSFKAHTPADAEKWFQIIRTVAGATGPAEASSTPASPVVGGDSVDGKFEDKPEMNTPAEVPAENGHTAQEAGVTGDAATVHSEEKPLVDKPVQPATAV